MCVICVITSTRPTRTAASLLFLLLLSLNNLVRRRCYTQASFLWSCLPISRVEAVWLQQQQMSFKKQGGSKRSRLTPSLESQVFERQCGMNLSTVRLCQQEQKSCKGKVNKGEIPIQYKNKVKKYAPKDPSLQYNQNSSVQMLHIFTWNLLLAVSPASGWKEWLASAGQIYSHLSPKKSLPVTQTADSKWDCKQNSNSGWRVHALGPSVTSGTKQREEPQHVTLEPSYHAEEKTTAKHGLVVSLG